MVQIHHLVGVVLLASSCGPTAIAGADDPPKKVVPEKKALFGGRPVTPPDVVLHVKSFRLKHCEPGELRQALSQLLQATTGIQPGMVSAGSRPGLLTGSTQAPYWVVDERTRTLVVRAPEAEIEKIAGFVEVLDSEPGKTPPTNNALHIVRLKHAKTDEALQALSGLHLNAQIVALPKSNILIVPAASPNVKEIDDVIEALDVEGIVPPKEKPAAEKKKKP